MVVLQMLILLKVFDQEIYSFYNKANLIPNNYYFQEQCRYNFLMIYTSLVPNRHDMLTAIQN